MSERAAAPRKKTPAAEERGRRGDKEFTDD